MQISTHPPVYNKGPKESLVGLSPEHSSLPHLFESSRSSYLTLGCLGGVTSPTVWRPPRVWLENKFLKRGSENETSFGGGRTQANHLQQVTFGGRKHL